jgi:hypothetical protein
MVTITEQPRTEKPETGRSTQAKQAARRLEAGSWGIFFIWVGYALLMELSMGVGLIGVGVIALLTQGVRRVFGLPLEGFWVFVGLGFLLGGLWALYAIDVPIAPVLLLGLGALLLAAALLKGRWGGGGA